MFLRNSFFVALGIFALSFASPQKENVFDDGSVLKPVSRLEMNAEIAAYMPGEKRLFVIGDEDLSIVDFSDPTKIRVVRKYEFDHELSSIALKNNIVAVAFPGENGREGILKIFEYAADSLRLLFSEKTCNTLDMVTFTPDGKKLLGACEGERASDQSIDAEGGVLVASFENGFAKPKIDVLNFTHFDASELLNQGVRNGYGSASDLFQALEPEYITVSEDSKTAWVSLQENNALAKVNLQTDKIENVFALGYMDFSKVPIAIRKGEKIIFENLPLLGMRQPDGIAVKTIAGVPYVFTADEGADMEGDSFSDVETLESKLKKGELDETVFDARVQKALEKAKLSKDRCGTKNDKDTCAFVYGTRSFSVFNGNSGELVWTSEDFIEKKTEKVAPSHFNWNSKKTKVKVNARSGDKGSSPENIVLAQVGNKTLAFIALERTSGIMVFDVTKPSKILYLGYYMNTSDRGPEGVRFISAGENSLNKPLLVVCYEYSSTLVVYEIKKF